MAKLIRKVLLLFSLNFTLARLNLFKGREKKKKKEFSESKSAFIALKLQIKKRIVSSPVLSLVNQNMRATKADTKKKFYSNQGDNVMKGKNIAESEREN